MSTATIRPTETRPPLIAALGGIRGLLDGGAPPLLFVAVNAIAGAQTTRPVALAIASTAAVGTGLALVILRRARRQPTRQALAGLAGLVIAVLFAAGSGKPARSSCRASGWTLHTAWPSPPRPSSGGPWRGSPTA